MMDNRLRSPTRKYTCTNPHNHQAVAPDSLMHPKSATALLRPIVARLPWWRYRNSAGAFCPSIRDRMTAATYSPPCLAAGAKPGTGFPRQLFATAVSPIAKILGQPGTDRSAATVTRPVLSESTPSHLAAGEAV